MLLDKFGVQSPRISRREGRHERSTMAARLFLSKLLQIARVGSRLEVSIHPCMPVVRNLFISYLNAGVRGWVNYYGNFTRSALRAVFNPLYFILAKWAMRKFRRLRGRPNRAHRWGQRVQVSPVVVALSTHISLFYSRLWFHLSSITRLERRPSNEPND